MSQSELDALAQKDENGDTYLYGSKNWEKSVKQILKSAKKYGLTVDMTFGQRLSLIHIFKVELAKDTDTIQLTTKETITELLPNDIDVSSIMWDTSNLPKTIQAPIKQGQEIGTIDLKLQNEVIQTVTVVAANDIDRSMWLYIGNILKKILTSWWFILLVVIIVVLLILYFVMVVVYNKRRRKGKIPVRRKKGQTVKRRRR